MKFLISTLAIVLVVFVNSAFSRPRHRPEHPENGHHHRHPPVCKVMNGTQTLCDKSQNCPSFTTCEKGKHGREDGLEFYICRPKVCYEEKDGVVITNSECSGELECVEGRHKGPENTLIKVCLPPHTSGERHGDDDEHKGRDQFCEPPRSGDRVKRHGPKGRHPPVCKIVDGTETLCDKSQNCPSFTTCEKGERGNRGGLEMHICRPKVCYEEKDGVVITNLECSGELECVEGRHNGPENTLIKVCLPPHTSGERHGDDDEHKGRDQFCEPPRSSDRVKRHGPKGRHPPVCKIVDGTETLCDKSQNCPSFTTCEKGERGNRGGLEMHICRPKVCYEEKDGVVITNLECSGELECVEGRHKGPENTLIKVCLPPHTSGERHGDDDEHKGRDQFCEPPRSGDRVKRHGPKGRHPPVCKIVDGTETLCDKSQNCPSFTTCEKGERGNRGGLEMHICRPKVCYEEKDGVVITNLECSGELECVEGRHKGPENTLIKVCLPPHTSGERHGDDDEHKGRDQFCEPPRSGDRVKRHGPKGRHPPVCKIVDGTETLCDKSQNCPSFTTCEKGERGNRGGLEMHICRPKVCYEEKDGVVITNLECSGELECVEGRHKGPENTLIKVCLPPHTSGERHGDDDEHKGRDQFCEPPRSGDRVKRHGPKGRHPPVCKIVDGTETLCDKSQNCPSFTTCEKGERGNRGGLEMHICRPKVCYEEKDGVVITNLECSGELECVEGRHKGPENTLIKVCLPPHTSGERHGDDDEHKGRDQFCEPPRSGDRVKRHGPKGRHPPVCKIVDGTETLCDKSQNCPSFTTCEKGERGNRGGLEMHICRPKVCYEEKDGVVITNLECSGELECVEGRHKGPENTLIKVCLPPHTSGERHGDDDEHKGRDQFCEPPRSGDRVKRHGPKGRHPPVCKIVDGTETLCDKSQNCPSFTTCEKGERGNRGGLEMHICRPKVCYEEKDGVVITNIECSGELECVEGRHKGPENTLIKVCLPPHTSGERHGDNDEHKGRDQFCEPPRSGDRVKRHAPKGRHPPVCKIVDGTETLCDKSQNCPSFTTCEKGEHGNRGGLEMHICRPKVCTVTSQCSGDLVCQEGRRGEEGTKYCLPTHSHEDGPKDNDHQRDMFCSPRTIRPS